MKNLTLLAFLTFGLMINNAIAGVDINGFTCEMHYKAKAKGVKFLIGSFKVNGKGTLTCIDHEGTIERLPIKIQFKTKKIAPQVAFGKFKINGASIDLFIKNGDIDDVLGSYRVAMTSGTVGVGGGVLTAKHLNLKGLHLSFAVQATKGLGLSYGLSKMKIKIDYDRLDGLEEEVVTEEDLSLEERLKERVKEEAKDAVLDSIEDSILG
jgi:hypothetical protein